MSKVIKTLAKFHMEFEFRCGIALNETMHRLLEQLNTIIMEEVCSRPQGESWNGRTYQFLNSWDKEQVMQIGDTLTSAISQNGYEQIWNSDEWSHGNAWAEFPMQSLDAVINDGLDESNFGFPAIEARPYWSTFLYWVQENLGEIFMQECIKAGLPVQKVGVL